MDDQGFWPESFTSEATIQSGKDQNGVNVWLALDDMPAMYQGSMAVSPSSHKASWRHDAYLALDQNRTQDGGKSKEAIIQTVQTKTDNHYATCDMHLVQPDLYHQIERTSKILDIKKGDVVFATRLLFHRTLSVTKEGISHFENLNQKYLKRYSIRYVPGSARLPNGWSVEWSVIDDPTQVGQSLDDIVESSGQMFYPQVWPTLEQNMTTGSIILRANEMIWRPKPWKK